MRGQLTNGTRFRLEFHHSPALAANDPQRRSYRRITTCLVKSLGEDGRPVDILAAGDAGCSPKDNFSRDVGRRVALTRAVVDFSREDRRAIWNAYITRSIESAIVGDRN